MESWRKVWREGLVPQLTIRGLQAVRRGLLNDDPRLTQGATTTPPPIQCVLDWPVEGACVLGYGAWQGDGVRTVGEVEAYFSEACMNADRKLGEPAAVRYFLNWYDDVPRAEMRRQLLAEVSRELARRCERTVAEPAVEPELVPA